MNETVGTTLMTVRCVRAAAHVVCYTDPGSSHQVDIMNGLCSLAAIGMLPWTDFTDEKVVLVQQSLDWSDSLRSSAVKNFLTRLVLNSKFYI